MKNKKLLCAICFLLLIPCLILPTSANSALTKWGGKDANGVLTTSEGCPIIVEHENLIFNINELPDTDPVMDNSDIDSSVTAEYTFYNPSDVEITAKLAFPFGIVRESDYNSDNEKYCITVNGERLNAEIRHTLFGGHFEYKFDVNKDLPRLLDEYIKDDFFNDQMTITKYSVKITDFDQEAYGVYWGLDINPSEYPDTFFYIPSAPSTWDQDDGNFRVGGAASFVGKTIDIYLFGKDRGIPELKFYTGSLGKDGEEARGSSTLVKKTVVDFREFIFHYYDENCGISEMDWYNASVINLQQYKSREKKYIYTARLNDDYKSNFMTWYYYDLTVGAGERITNSVTAPLIGGIDISKTAPVFDYTYLISPAATWSKFGDLDIYINTPYYLVFSNIDGFEKTENGYKLHLDGLPREKDEYSFSFSNGYEKHEGKVKDLVFKLCTEEKPIQKFNLLYVLLFYGVPILIGVVLLVLIIHIIRKIKKR